MEISIEKYLKSLDAEELKSIIKQASELLSDIKIEELNNLVVNYLKKNPQFKGFVFSMGVAFFYDQDLNYDLTTLGDEAKKIHQFIDSNYDYLDFFQMTREEALAKK